MSLLYAEPMGVLVLSRSFAEGGILLMVEGVGSG